MTEQAEAIVVGGGVIGCSVAYHLAAAGMSGVLLLERDRLGAGTTWHSAGNLTWKPTHLNDAMVLYGFELIERLGAATGVDPGWHRTGRLFLARSPAWLSVYEGFAAAAEDRGVGSALLSPAEAARRHPLLDPGAIEGAWLNTLSGRLSPANLTEAYARGARAGGATIREDCPVERIETRNGRVSGVITPAGIIETERVIVCAGLWSRSLVADLGIALAQGGNEHFYVIADLDPPLGRDVPSFICPEDLIYGREEVGGLLFGCFDEDATPLDPEDLPLSFAFSLLNEDWDKFGPYFEKAARLFPVLQEAGIRSFINGPESFTPDGLPLVGPVAAVSGLTLCTGMNSYGVTVSAALGHAIADRLTGRPPRFLIDDMTPERFGAAVDDAAWLALSIAAAPSQGYTTSNQ